MKHWLHSSRIAMVACVIGLFLVSAAQAANPTVAITSPPNNLHTTNSSLLVEGTALSRDTNDPLASVTVTVNGNPQTASGTTSWQANVTLAPGDNVITAQSTTVNNAQSAPVTRHVTLQVFTVLSVTTNGNGIVSPNLNGRTLLVGSTVRMRAIPAPDWSFTGWSGSTSDTNATLVFTVTEGASLTANFAPNPLHLVRGVYNGLIVNTNNITRESSGYFTLIVNKPNTYVLQLIQNGRRATASGRIDNNGHADFTARGAGVTISGSFQLDLSGVSDQVTGDITDPTAASMVGDRDVFDGRSNLCPFAGQYNMIVSPNAVVDGQGYATVFVDGSGSVRMNGVLADGTPISQSTTVSKNGFWPMFSLINGNKGAFTGWLRFQNTAQSSLNGNANWFHPALARGAYSNEFSLRSSVVGSLFIQPPRGVSIMAWTDGIGTIGGDNMPVQLTSHLTWNSNNVITVDLADFSFAVGPFGTLRGSLIRPVTHNRDILQGVILPKTNWAGGFFLDAGTSGFFDITQDLTAGGTLVNAPGDINTGVLTLTLDKKTGFFTGLNTITINIGSTTVTTDIADFGTANYNYSSYSSTSANIAELNIVGGTIRNHQVVWRMLLHFTDNQNGTFIAQITAGGVGTATGTFTLP